MAFFESIGVDPKTVVADDITNLGYYTFVPVDQEGSGRLYSAGSGQALCEFHEWPTSMAWFDFVAAAREDWKQRGGSGY